MHQTGFQEKVLPIPQMAATSEADHAGQSYFVVGSLVETEVYELAKGEIAQRSESREESV